MPRAYVERWRGERGDVFYITPQTEYELDPTAPGGVRRIDPELPAGLSEFAGEGMICGPGLVTIPLREDESGVDVTPVLVLADWLQERGWELDLPWWIVKRAD